MRLQRATDGWLVFAAKFGDRLVQLKRRLRIYGVLLPTLIALCEAQRAVLASSCGLPFSTTCDIDRE
jgi:hypothetical protein